MKFDVDQFSEEERLLIDRSFEEVLRHAGARVAVDVEEEEAAISKRPTVPAFAIVPWQ